MAPSRDHRSEDAGEGEGEARRLRKLGSSWNLDENQGKPSFYEAVS